MSFTHHLYKKERGYMSFGNNVSKIEYIDQLHADLYAAYNKGEYSVLEKLAYLETLAPHSESVKHLLGKALIFGNLKNIKWIPYCQDSNLNVVKMIEAETFPVIGQNLGKGIKYYSEILINYSKSLDPDDTFAQFTSYELYQILTLPDEVKIALKIDIDQEKTETLKSQIIRILGYSGYTAILNDYNEYFINSESKLSNEQKTTIVNNYKLVSDDHSLPKNTQSYANNKLYSIYRNGLYGEEVDLDLAVTYLHKSFDYSFIEKSAIELYHLSLKEIAYELFSKSFQSQISLQLWLKDNEPDWYLSMKANNNFLALIKS